MRRTVLIAGLIAGLVVALGLAAGCRAGAVASVDSSTAPPSAPALSSSSASRALSTGPTGSAQPAVPSSVPTSAAAEPSVTVPEPAPPALADETTDGTSRETAAEPVIPADPEFTGLIAPVDAALAARMASSWRPGCPVALADLRYLTLTYRGLDGTVQQGELAVAASVAEDVVAIFRQLYEIGYPIASMRLVDDFAGDDDASMAANNTSAFNCRPVTGGGGFSEHSYGTAIDVNPVQNPYLSGSVVLPAAGGAYLDRPDAPAVLHAGDAVVTAFADHGFSWGGNWHGPIDYQHFSVSGR